MAMTQNGVLKRDDNDTPVMGGVSSVDGVTIINSAFDPVTRRLLVDTSVTSVSLNDSLTDGEYSGITIDGTAGAALAFGDLVYLDPTDSRWELTDANSALGADGDARGSLGICVLAAAADGDATRILTYGVVRADAAFPTMTINSQIYVSETAGDITGTQPSTSGVVIRVVGTGRTADTLFFNPSSDYLTRA